MSIFEEIANSEATEGGNYITKDGRYLFLVTKIGMTTKARKGKIFFANFQIVESHETVQGVVPHAVGSSVAWLQVVGHSDEDRRKMALGNTKKFILSLFNKIEADLKPEELKDTIEELISDKGMKEQLAKGFLIKGETYQKPTKAGQPRMYVNFFGVENLPADVKRRRLALDQADAELAAE